MDRKAPKNIKKWKFNDIAEDYNFAKVWCNEFKKWISLWNFSITKAAKSLRKFNLVPNIVLLCLFLRRFFRESSKNVRKLLQIIKLFFFQRDNFKIWQFWKLLKTDYFRNLACRFAKWYLFFEIVTTAPGLLAPGSRLCSKSSR